MASKLFEVGDLVWAKMKGFAPWPAQIKEPPKENRTPSKMKHQNYVYFFGSKNYAWIQKNDITPHSNKMVQAANLKKKTKQLESAIDEILLLSEKLKKKSRAPDVESNSETSTSKKLSPNKRRAADIKAMPSKKRQRKIEKTAEKPVGKVGSRNKKSIRSEEHVENRDNQSVQLSKISSSSHPKTPHGPKASNEKPGPSAKVGSSYYAILENLNLPQDSYKKFVNNYKTKSGHAFYSKRNPPPISPRLPVYVKKPTPTLDILTVCDYVKEKNVVATNKKIGFIGLGSIGRGIVKSLLNTGHDVTVWNHIAERCEPFVAAGARCASTPADVVLASDIIFSCLKNQEIVNTVVYRSEGVLNGFIRSSEPGKIYAEMTLINKETAETICQNIVAHKGIYLEASFYGTKDMAENGKLILTVAGDPDAYNECESCFKAMSQTINYTGTRFGNVCNIAIHAYEGKLAATVAEIMYIAKKANINQKDFFELLKILSPYYCDLIKDVAEAIISQDYSPQVSVSRILNAMKLMKEPSGSGSSYVSSAIRGIYAKAEQLNYGSHDMSAAYLMYDLPGPSSTSAQEVQESEGKSIPIQL